jgi:hypothetical protein
LPKPAASGPQPPAGCPPGLIAQQLRRYLLENRFRERPRRHGLGVEHDASTSGRAGPPRRGPPWQPDQLVGSRVARRPGALGARAGAEPVAQRAASAHAWSPGAVAARRAAPRRLSQAAGDGLASSRLCRRSRAAPSASPNGHLAPVAAGPVGDPADVHDRVNGPIDELRRPLVVEQVERGEGERVEVRAGGASRRSAGNRSRSVGRCEPWPASG